MKHCLRANKFEQNECLTLLMPGLSNQMLSKKKTPVFKSNGCTTLFYAKQLMMFYLISPFVILPYFSLKAFFRNHPLVYTKRKLKHRYCSILWIQDQKTCEYMLNSLCNQSNVKEKSFNKCSTYTKGTNISKSLETHSVKD